MSKQCVTHHFACDCREEKFKLLELENNALRVRLEILAINSKKQTEELERENAALRKALKRWLKVTDDCHQEQQEVGYSEYNITVGLVCDTRALLDAARKETRT